MKKYILVMILSVVSLLSFNSAYAQTTEQNKITACNNKVNGQACEFKTQLSNRDPVEPAIGGFCDRNGDGRLYCNSTKDGKGELSGWKDCFNRSQPNDACKNSSGQSGTCQRQGSGDNFTCDTTKPPTVNTGGGTCQSCGGATCSAGQVCANDPGGKPKCVSDQGKDGKCGAESCSAGQVCLNDVGGKPKCIQNQCTGGGGAGNGGGGTTAPGNETPTDATAPQTVGFINPIRFNSLTELIAGIINALLGILGAITVAVLVLSGFKYMTSSNPGEVGAALDGIRNAIVGLMIIMGSFLITQYVISALAG